LFNRSSGYNRGIIFNTENYIVLITDEDEYREILYRASKESEDKSLQVTEKLYRVKELLEKHDQQTT
jgi:hypothetical protein